MILSTLMIAAILGFMPRIARAPDGTGGGDEGQQQQQQQQQQQEPPANPLLAQLPEDLRAHPAWKDAQVKDLATLAKRHTEVFDLVGRKGVIVPTKDSKPEEVDKFWTALGRPETADKYVLPKLKGQDGKEVDYDETTQRLVKGALPHLHKAGQTQGQIDGITAAVHEAVKAEEKMFGDYLTAGEAALQKKHGDKLPEVLTRAESFAKRSLGTEYENFNKLVLVGADGKKGFLSDNPLLVEAFAMAEEAFATGDFGPGGKGPGNMLSDPVAAKQQLDEWDAAAATDSKHWINNPSTPEGKKMGAERERLSRIVAQDKLKKSKGG